jgi:hypothetical protein
VSSGELEARSIPATATVAAGASKRRAWAHDPKYRDTRVRKEKALGSCELRALLHDAPSSACTRHGRRRITGHRRTLRSDNATYARALDRAHNL